MQDEDASARQTPEDAEYLSIQLRDLAVGSFVSGPARRERVDHD
jgi:hypothetical protein